MDEDKEYTVSVIAVKTGYKNGTQSMPVNVINIEVEGPEQETPFPSFLMVASVFSVVAVSVAVFRRIRA